MQPDFPVQLATEADVPALRLLVNAAYRQLADMGLNFTGTYQDERVTRERMQGREVYLICIEHELVGTISLHSEQQAERQVLYITQFAVAPTHQRQGIGAHLLQLAERRAKELGLAALQLDTAAPATHLVAMYRKAGYQVIREVQWEGKTYKSYIMEKQLIATAGQPA